MNAKYSSTNAPEMINNVHHFMKDAPGELGMNWAAFVILATLASPGISYLSAAEIIENTKLNRCWVYRNIRVLLHKGLVDFVNQPGPPKQVRKLYTVNGKGSFYLTQALSPNGIRIIKTFEAANL